MKIVGTGRCLLKKKITLYNLTASSYLMINNYLNWIRDNRIGSIYIFDTLDTLDTHDTLDTLDTLAELRVSTVSTVSRYTPGILILLMILLTKWGFLMAYRLLLCGIPILSTRANYEVLSRFERENGGPGGDFEADNAY